MAISEVKEVKDKEEAESIITSAKGTYPAVLLKGRLGNENLDLSDLDPMSEDNNALIDDTEIKGSYYVWYWCPSVDGEYKVDNKCYERVNVPKFSEVNGEELKYRAGDIIDVSFDNGQVNAPRFVRLWGLIHTDEGREAVKSNIVGLKTGMFPASLPDALNLYSNQEGFQAYNLYPYLCKILTGREDPTDGQYANIGTNSKYYQFITSSSHSWAFSNAIASRFFYSFYPLSSYWTASSGNENEVTSWNPFEKEITTGGEAPSSRSVRGGNHLQPYWIFSEMENDITCIENLYTFLVAVKTNGVDRSPQEAQDLFAFYTEQMNKQYQDILNGEDAKENEKNRSHIPYKEFSSGPNSKVRVNYKKGFLDFSDGTKEVTLKTEPILESISDKGKISLIREAISSYWTAILNLSLALFPGERADNYFDVLVYTSLYIYVRHFYGSSVTVADTDISTDPVSTEDYRYLLINNDIYQDVDQAKIYNRIIDWATEFFNDTSKDPEEIKEAKKTKLSFIQNVDNGYAKLEEGKYRGTLIGDERVKKTIKLIEIVRNIYYQYTSVDQKYPVLYNWIKIFDDKPPAESNLSVEGRVNRLLAVKSLISSMGEETFAEKINSQGSTVDTSVTTISGELQWPVPDAVVSKSSITSSYSGSKVMPTTRKNHKGIDISIGGIFGKPIVAAMDGVVSGVVNTAADGVRKSNSYGNMVIITNGSLSTLYGHCKKGSVYVKNGETVKKGQTIANVGNSGDSSGPHLHFEVRRGTAISYYSRTPEDPLEYFFGTKVNNANNGGTTSNTGNLSGNAKIIADILKERSLSNAAIAAILGNIQGESSFNPAIVNSLGYSGLCQWGGGRKTSMFNAVPDWRTNVRGQIEFMWRELNGSYKYVLSDLQKASNDLNGVSLATSSFLHKYEIPCVHNSSSAPSAAPYTGCSEYKKRYAYAKSFFESLNK